MLTLPVTPPAALSLLLMLLKVTCLLLAALAASLAMSRASAGSRHLVWLVVLAALLVMPALAAWSPLSIRVLPALAAAPLNRELHQPGAGPDATRPEESSAASSPSTVTGSEPTGFAGVRALSIGSMLVLGWAVMALVLAGRLAYGAYAVRRIVRRARPLDDAAWQTPLYEIADRLELDHAPRLVRSEDVKMPFAAGVFSATIVLPAESDEWSAERRSAVLIHELGHVRRRDLIGHTVGRISCALYWFHPLVWTAARRLRAESERACDDLALVFGARPSDYAEHLLEIVTCVRDHYTPSVALAMAHRKEFEGRMLAILNPELRRRGPSRSQSASIIGSLALVSLLVGAAAPVPREAPQSPVVTSRPNPAAAPDRADTGHTRLSLETAPPAVPHVPVLPGQRAHTGDGAMRDTIPATSADDRAAVLARTLRSDPNASVRRVAAWGLQRYAREDVGRLALVGAVGSDADASVREMAAWALASARRSADAADALGKAIRQDHDSEVRATAAWALGSMGCGEAIGPLVEALRDSSAVTRDMAAWSIGSCRPDRAPAPLVAALNDRDRDVRESVAWALYTIRDTETSAAVASAVRRETDSDVQVGLIRALGSLGDGSVSELERLVASPDTAVRNVAIRALAGGGATGPWPWPRPQPRPFP